MSEPPELELIHKITVIFSRKIPIAYGGSRNHIISQRWLAVAIGKTANGMAGEGYLGYTHK